MELNQVEQGALSLQDHQCPTPAREYGKESRGWTWEGPGYYMGPILIGLPGGDVYFKKCI